MEYKQLFYQIKKEWRDKIQENEWYFSDVRDLFLKEIDITEIFEVIDFVVNSILLEKDLYFISELLELLISLVRKMNSSQIPDCISENLLSLDEIFQRELYLNERWKELKKLLYLDNK